MPPTWRPAGRPRVGTSKGMGRGGRSIVSRRPGHPPETARGSHVPLQAEPANCMPPIVNIEHCRDRRHRALPRRICAQENRDGASRGFAEPAPACQSGRQGAASSRAERARVLGAMYVRFMCVRAIRETSGGRACHVAHGLNWRCSGIPPLPGLPLPRLRPHDPRPRLQPDRPA